MDAATRQGRVAPRNDVKVHFQGEHQGKREPSGVLVAKTYTRSTHPGGEKKELQSEPRNCMVSRKKGTKSRQGRGAETHDQRPNLSPNEESENGMEEQGGSASYLPGMPKDIQREVREILLQEQPAPVRTKMIRFEDTPVIIPLSAKRPDQYNICQDLMDQKADVTFGQLLHDNVNYQQQVEAKFGRKGKQRYVLPSKAVNFVLTEDLGAPKIDVIIDGICVPNVPVDGGAGVNVMLETTAFELGYSKFESTPTVLQMADQSKVLPIGQLSQVPTTIAGHTYLLNYMVIRVDVGNPFPVLLGRPWLYLADVKVDWERQEF
jgi:hypothetical protein